MVLAAHLQEWPAEDAWGKNKKQVQNEFLPYQPASEMKAEPALTSGTFFLIVMPQEFFWCGISICMPFLLFEECISLPLGLVWQQGGLHQYQSREDRKQITPLRQLMRFSGKWSLIRDFTGKSSRSINLLCESWRQLQHYVMQRRGRSLLNSLRFWAHPSEPHWFHLITVTHPRASTMPSPAPLSRWTGIEQKVEVTSPKGRRSWE